MPARGPAVPEAIFASTALERSTAFAPRISRKAWRCFFSSIFER
jgi:hypothetical protein